MSVDESCKLDFAYNVVKGVYQFDNILFVRLSCFFFVSYTQKSHRNSAAPACTRTYVPVALHVLYVAYPRLARELARSVAPWAPPTPAGSAARARSATHWSVHGDI